MHDRLANVALSVFAVASILAPISLALAQPSPGPVGAPLPPEIAPPLDRPYSGVIQLSIDATDTERKIVRVHETIPAAPGDLTLLYPKWLPGTHAPEGAIDRLAGVVFKANGAVLGWARDPVDVYAFHLAVPSGASGVDVDFQYLSPVDDHVGEAEITSSMMVLEFVRLALYPAGAFSRQIQVTPTVTLPSGWQFGTALEAVSGAGGTPAEGNRVTFKTTNLATLADSPLFAGKYFARFDLDPEGKVPVHLDIVADRPSLLLVAPDQLAAHKALIQQAYRLFGSHHYDHYDFLLSLSEMVPRGGLEHHQSSEDNTYSEYFADYDKNTSERDLLPHEYTHSWNGKFRRPEDLWTPNFNVPMRDSLLWVYEGQTEYWGMVLAARSGLWTKQQALDELAMVAATYDNMPGRKWRPLADTTNDEILNPRRPISWRSWQRFEDYYDEGALIWLEADMIIRAQSHGAKSLDDFARAFFGIDDGSFVTGTYDFDDVVKALNGVVPYDWAKFMRQRLDSTGQPAPLEGLHQGGYKLVFTENASDLFKSMEAISKTTNLTFSLGLVVDKDGELKSVLWDGPAFKAGLTAGDKVIAINGAPFDPDILKDAVRSSKGGQEPIELIVKKTDLYRVARLDYHGGPRYPHLERDPAQTAGLDDVLAPRK